MAAPQKYQGVDTQSSGFRLLSAMGWREGEGLGLHKQGIKSHVRVKKKLDSQGIGAAEADKRNQEWTTGMLAFDSILAKLSVAATASTATEAGPKAAKKKRKRLPSSEEEAGAEAAALSGEGERPQKQKKGLCSRESGSDAGAAGGRAFQQQQSGSPAEVTEAAAQAEQEGRRGAEGGKKKKKKSRKAAVLLAEPTQQLTGAEAPPEPGREGEKRKKKKKQKGVKSGAGGEVVAAEASAAKERQGGPSGAEPLGPGAEMSQQAAGGAAGGTAAARSQQQGKRAACHTARFARRRAGKLVGGYSSTDLAAILGSSAPPVPGSLPLGNKEAPRGKAGRAEHPSASDTSADTHLAEEAEEEGVSAPAAPSAARRDAAAPPGGQGAQRAWWATSFVSRGPLEGLSRPAPKADQGTGFREEDQTALYSAAQAARSTAQQGLGARGQPRKAGGVRWQGTRTIIQDEEAEEAEVPAAGADSGEVERAAEGQKEGRAARKGSRKGKKAKQKQLTDS